MKIFEKKWSQQLSISIEEAWNFFSRPENLNEITPPNMNFNILSDIRNLDMYAGMIIRYRITPFLNLSMNWVTEITYIKDFEYFVDEQRFGPYAFWHHQHHFFPNDHGTLMIDHLHYAVPFGFLGTFLNSVFIDREIEHIFEYRKQFLTKKFNSIAV